MKRDEFINNYWKYYLLLEEKVINCEKYVAICEDNYGTYSFEFIGILNLIGSEIDVIRKLLDETKKGRITDLFKKLKKEQQDDVNLSDYNILSDGVWIGDKIQIYPFENWKDTYEYKELEWWKAYNSVKHSRKENIKKANLKNVLYALAGLYMLEIKVLTKISSEETLPGNPINNIPNEKSRLFRFITYRSAYEIFVN